MHEKNPRKLAANHFFTCNPVRASVRYTCRNSLGANHSDMWHILNISAIIIIIINHDVITWWPRSFRERCTWPAPCRLPEGGRCSPLCGTTWHPCPVHDKESLWTWCPWRWHRLPLAHGHSRSSTWRTIVARHGTFRTDRWALYPATSADSGPCNYSMSKNE